MSKVNSWGRVFKGRQIIKYLSQNESLLPTEAGQTGLAFGQGRSYGDACLNPSGVVWGTSQLNRFKSLNTETKTLTCDAGITLKEIQDALCVQGWLLPVTPGTQMVSVGGAIANDVHGKNHHLFGSFGHQVESFTLLRTDGSTHFCSRHKNPELFSASIGGLGLTGVITSATLKLKDITTPWLITEKIPYYSLEEFFELSRQSETHWEHTVSWFDCLSKNKLKGIFMRGNPTQESSLHPYMPHRLTVPFSPPITPINNLSLSAFNKLYFAINKKSFGKTELSHYQSFLYPLDNIQNWNKMYGIKGFYQYQCVIPMENSHDAISEMLAVIRELKQGSFLAVLKTFGDIHNEGMLSFPMHGTTLALDFPNRDKSTHNLFNKLNAIVANAKGRIYMAKDALQPSSLFLKGYKNIDLFQTFRDPGINSALADRLFKPE